MIIFLATKWLFPSKKNRTQDVTQIFIIMIILCSFLTLLSSFIIQFLQFSMLESLTQKDFHFSFLANSKNIQLWNEHKEDWENQAQSCIQKEFMYVKQPGLILQNNMTIPLQLQIVEDDYLDYFYFPYKQGGWDSSLPSISISEEVAYQLNVEIGSVVEFHYIKQNYFFSEPTSIKLLVSGILKKTPASDPYFAIAPLSFLQESFYHQLQLGIMVAKTSDTLVWKKIIFSKEKLRVNDIYSRHYNLFYSFNWEKILLYFVLIVVLLISFFIVYVSFSLVFQEYKKQWSILKVLGVPVSSMVYVFMLKTALILIFGFFIGFIGAFSIFTLYTLWVDIPLTILIQQIIQWDMLLYLFIIEVLMSLIAFTIPVFKIYSQSVLEGLKDES